jgi:UDP-N-acetylenolpyruvoylglucosamine reductase
MICNSIGGAGLKWTILLSGVSEWPFGLENLSSIPGTVGGTVQNIGAMTEAVNL